MGSDSEAASRLEAYDTVYNSWGCERDIMHTELCSTAYPGGRGDGTVDARKLFRAVSRGWETRGSN